MKKIGLALGGGGAKGLAHIPVLQVFDDLNVRPHCITGTSIGAVIGALYAAGLTGRQIRERVQQMIISRGDSFKQVLKKKEAFKTLEFFDWSFKTTGLFKGDKFLEFLFESMGVARFEGLEIPLSIVTSDFWTAEEIVLTSGELLPAVKASMGLPGLFTPVEREGRVLVDGGGVNPLPHDLLRECDLIVAIDVLGSRTRKKDKVPNIFRAVIGMFNVMQHTIVEQKLKLSPPDIYIKPDIQGVDMLEFHKADRIFEQAEPACLDLRRQLEECVLVG